ncbi:uncharacterized protein LOC18432119 isoform X2 [Amborella trichopoda]|uniref:uncharacterized protein LOC18432119 isoform X2 n=1 Tax=Amborella trichopoda TaxID=13333 RepID=UPI0005D403A8|nr:uncharacterized protein LOC18432119 isoform X2 [Amborella trichopoda]|eukprot:XP_011622580.1 uncharacterized protein LOC18432119 isoform X2 [Amborella trichopoda]
MSLLNSLFNRGVLGAKCKTCLKLAISRIKLLRNKREVQLKQMRKEIAQFLQTGQEPIARIRVEHIIREQNIVAAYEIIELFCEFVLVRVPIIDTQRECPKELQEAIASIIFAAPRCSDLPELMHIQNLFTAKYGKEFTSAASELRPDSGVNRGDGSNHVRNKAQDTILTFSSQKEGESPHSIVEKVQKVARANSPIETDLSALSKSVLMGQSRSESLEIKHEQEDSNGVFKREKIGNSLDILAKAQAAIASAERARAAARAAAELVNVKMVINPASCTFSRSGENGSQNIQETQRRN